MSLFKAREWWSTTAGYEEFHDIGCLCVGNIDNSASNLDKIVVGSYQGILRVYSPRAGPFTPAHLMIEVNLVDPILQLALGTFVSNSNGVHLLVLHPRRLVVHSLSVEKTEVEDQYRLHKLYEHKLERTAYNMVHGPFGAPKDMRESICVQSIDGQLSVYEQDMFTFARFLPNTVIPGPMGYVRKTNAIVTVTGDHKLEAFTYRALVGASSTAVNKDKESRLPYTGKRLTSDWSINLGENALQIEVVTPKSWGASNILVLGEHSLFCCHDSGTLHWMMKLDYTPSCFHVFNVCTANEDGERDVKYIVATHSNMLMIYNNVTLEWTSQLPYPPVAVSTGSFEGLKGVVVTLDELGHVTCSYMGTDPSNFTPPTPQAREMDYEKMDKEFKQLQKVVRESVKGSEVSPVVKQSEVIITSEVVEKPRVIMLSDGDHVSTGEGDAKQQTAAIQLCCEVMVQLSVDHMISDVLLTVDTDQPLAVHPCIFRWTEIAAGDVNPITLTVVCTPSMLPSNTSAAVVTVMYTASQRPAITQYIITLPLSLFCRPVAPAKNAEHKVTIDTNSPPVSLFTLFPEFTVSDEETVPQNAMGFQLLPGAEVTLVVSKTSERYRLQSDCFEALALFEAELVKRLRQHYKDTKCPPFKASFTDPLPLKEYFEVIDNHFKLRVEREQYLIAVEQHAQQFRAIQKRLLNRFKDKTPSSLQHLDTLLDGTFLQLMALSERCQSIEEELAVINNKLSCASDLIADLLQLSAGMCEEEHSILKACLHVNPDHLTEQGWEEKTTSAVMHMLITCLSKTSKEQQSAIPANMEMPGDTGKLKKQLTVFFDRLVKGGRLNSRGEFSNWPSRDLMKREPVSLPSVINEVTEDVIED